MSFNSELDVSNHGYLFKMIEDSLVKCKLLNDDNDEFVKQVIMEKQTAVSYTHLDVYKRQEEDKERVLMAIQSAFFIAKEKNKIKK